MAQIKVSTRDMKSTAIKLAKLAISNKIPAGLFATAMIYLLNEMGIDLKTASLSNQKTRAKKKKPKAIHRTKKPKTYLNARAS